MTKEKINLNIKREIKTSLKEKEIKATSEISHSEDTSFNSNENETETKNKKQLLYFTPISYQKKIYTPSTPQKIKESGEKEEIIVFGRNLLQLFESL